MILFSAEFLKLTALAFAALRLGDRLTQRMSRRGVKNAMPLSRYKKLHDSSAISLSAQAAG
jgi:hypothetical protein